MKKRNYYLIFGLIIVLCIIGTAVFAFDLINGRQYYRYTLDNIIFGARLTLKLALLITLFKFLIALPMAFKAGFGGKISSTLIELFSTAFSSIPALLICIFIFMSIPSTIANFVVVVALVSWGRLSKSLKDSVQNILNSNFIEGEIAIGKSKILIAIQNVLPHLLPVIITYFFIEMSRSLIMIAELAVFRVVVVNSANIYSAPQELGVAMKNRGFTFYEPEWGIGLSSARNAFLQGKPYRVMYPALAFFISVLGFNLLGEGLKIEVSKRESMAITRIKRMAFHLSPLTFLYEIRNYKRYKKNLAIKTAVIIAIIVVLLIPPPKSLYRLNTQQVFAHIEELSKEKYVGRLVGTTGRDFTSDYIIKNLKESNIEPLFNGSYTQEFTKHIPIATIMDSRIVIRDEKGEKKAEFIYREDFNFTQLFSEELSGLILTQDQYEKKKFDISKDYFLVLDNNNPITVEKYATQDGSKEFIKGLIVPVKDKNYIKSKQVFLLQDLKYYNKGKSLTDFRAFIIGVTTETFKMIKEYHGKEIVLKSEVDVMENTTIKNIGGIIQGTTSDPKDNLIIVTNYDYVGNGDDEDYKGLCYNGSSISASLEIAKKLSSIDKKPKKNIFFLFVDSSKLENMGAEEFAYNEQDRLGSKTVFITLNYLGLKGRNKLYMDITRLGWWNFDYVKYLRKRSGELGINLEITQLFSGYEDAYHLRDYGCRGLIFKGVNNGNIGKYFGKPQNEVEEIDSGNLKQQAQLILDTIVRFAY
jgi:peptide/nickel transport system permease protein